MEAYYNPRTPGAEMEESQVGLGQLEKYWFNNTALQVNIIFSVLN